LTVRVTSTSRDETGQLLSSLQAMNENLIRVVSDVRLSSERIVTGTTEIAGGNLDLSHRTERQAASLEETAATMQEIRAAVHNNSETARQASAMAKSASAAAVKGGQVVNQVVKTMEEITSSSKRIEDITGVIDGIAFQTNILALNAAVEAARAGEQGRGFAVVASEVRSLAQRSASAAKEIKGLISASAETVSTGSRLVSEAGGNMADLVSQVGRLATLISEISSATNLQTTGMDQMGDAITGLDQVTQQNAALVEESAAASESLKLQAERLMESVQVFKLSEQEDVQGLLLSNSLSFQQNSLTTSTQRSFS
jgi:methyl-accepting chemotaxis protein